jgi:hypothetical protein
MMSRLNRYYLIVAIILFGMAMSDTIRIVVRVWR